jgi:hypothetical protein
MASIEGRGARRKPSDTSLEKTMAFSHSDAQQPKQLAFRDDLIAWLRTVKAPEAWVGLTAITWARSFSPELANQFAQSGYAELHRHLSRDELHAFCARADVHAEFRVAAVMAWGRSNPRRPQNNRNLWASIPNIAPLLGRMPTLTREQAFAEFRHLVIAGALKGMRASFFTKLMFFFGCQGAYILDQWTAKATLALWASNWLIGDGGKPTFIRGTGHFVRLGYGGTSIDLAMSDSEYEQYCLALESLIVPLGRSDGADVELWLFSEPRSEWRRFLKALDWKVNPAATPS